MGERIDAWRASDGKIFFAEQDMLDHEEEIAARSAVLEWAAQYGPMTPTLRTQVKRVLREPDLVAALQDYFAYIA